ncbi:MAG: undecaprenyl-phosphate glucose phosphotransferase [Rhodothermales bacterium]|nr:undecaprenyl-phosphate glucose phosphotransferase [Rhodothermales bacterium]MBO6779154.1 undecaprenyl-phosphate glucose phosphotransferase [Rhodothermales bacterium]
MLQEQSRLFQRLLFFADLVLVALGWILAYYIRFELFLVLDFLPPPEWQPFERYLGFLPGVLLVSMAVFWGTGLYIPDRAQKWTRLVTGVVKSVTFGVLLLAASLSFYRAFYFSRLHMAIFASLTPAMMLALRLGLLYSLRRARAQGKYRRRVLIVGAGEVGRRLKGAFEQYPWMGFELHGFLDDTKTGPEILGTTTEAIRVLDEAELADTPIDYVYLALPLSASDRIEQILSAVSTRLAHVFLVPDLFQFDILNSRVTDVDGLPVIHIIDEAPLDFPRAVKRLIDVVFSATFLIVTSPLLLLIAIAVKLSSPGPVLYKQERMGLNGQRFNILKFRSMPVQAEAQTGAVWAKPGEDRATRVGAFLRRTSLDELPQFINVLRGEMSVVGPRPERPVFIDSFRDRVPKYMLRHKMKAGITGWAQVNGWRGDTSIEKRIEHDIFYIQHWSLKLDIKIMLMTVFTGFVNKNAY